MPIFTVYDVCAAVEAGGPEDAYFDAVVAENALSAVERVLTENGIYIARLCYGDEFCDDIYAVFDGDVPLPTFEMSHEEGALPDLGYVRVRNVRKFP